jgi:hypothetical protein
MRRCLLLLPLTACSLYFPPDRGGTAADGGLGADAALPAECQRPYTATIFEPTPGTTSATTLVTAHLRWNQAGIPDRYTSMADDFGNFFTSAGVIQGDGSLIDHYELPRGGTFTFDVGWICDAAHGGHEVILATSRFHTPP